MNNKILVKREDWEHYWRYHKIKPLKRVFFEDKLKYFPKSGSLIEIGGFPGKFAGYLKTKFEYEVYILDYYIDKNIISEVEKAYKLNKGDIKIIEADLFSYSSDKKYDIVISIGFIEHFEDTFDVIKRHYDLVKEDGILFITLPNFKGINGFIQKYFDKKNYKMHNINSMDLNYLKRILEKLNIKEHNIFYYGKYGLWLEPTAEVNFFTRKVIRILSRIINKFPPFSNKIFSPYIIIYAKK